MLSAVNIHQEQIGVSKIVGFCENRAGTNVPDLAFRVQAESQLSVSTYPIFQSKYMIYLRKYSYSREDFFNRMFIISLGSLKSCQEMFLKENDGRDGYCLFVSFWGSWSNKIGEFSNLL